MSPELIAELVTAAFQTAGVILLGTMLYRLGTKQMADDAALFLEGRRLEQALREMRESLVEEPDKSSR